jgi:membrane protein YdbS with pleckstrin-like domain
VNSTETPRPPASVDAVFRAPEASWRPVSERLITARRLVAGIWWLVAVAVAALALVLTEPPGWVVAVVVAGLVVLAAWAWWYIARRVRSYGYAERADDLLVTSGILLRRMVVVPYGRMQLVDVVAGPVDRALGLTTVQLHTAAATTDATIPGLLPDEAAALRDRLAARGEERSAGL